MIAPYTECNCCGGRVPISNLPDKATSKSDEYIIWKCPECGATNIYFIPDDFDGTITL